MGLRALMIENSLVFQKIMAEVLRSLPEIESVDVAGHNADGLAIAGTWDILVTAGLSQPISLTAYGLPITADTPCVNDFVWTGTDMTGLPWGDMFCAEWTSDASDISVAVGSALSAVSPDWTQCNTASCGTLARLYCFEQALD